MRNDRERLDVDHEVSLYGLVELLWRRRLFLFVVSLLAMLMSVFYVATRTPLYEGKVIVEVPTQNDISQLNYGRGGDSGLEVLTAGAVYDVYVRNLLSESLRRHFFQSVYLPQLTKDERKGSQEELYAGFAQVLKIVPLDKSVPSRYSITARLPDPAEAAQWVARYAELAGVSAKSQILKDVGSDAAVKAGNLRQQIAAEREMARKQREDREVRLSEALAVAKSIGLERPPVISGQLVGELSSGISGTLSYMRGSDALEAEIEGLRARASDDPFIDGLRERQVALDFYDELKILPSAISVYRQDGPVELPDKSVLPSAVLLVFMAMILGLIVAIVIVLAHHLASAVFLSVRSGAGSGSRGGN